MINTISTTNNDNPVLRSIITGAVASAIASSTVNYRKVKNKEISTTLAIKETVKRSSQGAIATGAAVQTANYLTQKGGFLKAMTTISIGMAGIYAIEILDDKLDEKYSLTSCCNKETKGKEEKVDE
ncbi:MAG: hypothetical protein ACNI25_02910 [Halarcobacter sp.]